MSERRQAQSEVTQASLGIGSARGQVQETVRYLEMYDFLRDANADLLRALRAADEALATMERRLWDAEVASTPVAQREAT